MMLADCELGSNYSSVSSDHIRMYCGRQFSECLYDNLYVENVRNSMIAERKKPLLITYPKVITAERNVELQSNKIEKDFLKSRYEARRKFFQDLERQTQKSQESVISSKAKATNINNVENIENNGENISQQNFAVIPMNYTEVYNSHLIKKNMKENLNDQVHWNIIMHSVKRENIAQPSFVKIINLGETKPSTKKKSLISRSSNEKSNNAFELLIEIDEKQQQQQHLSETMTKTTKTEVILTRNCVEIPQRGNNSSQESSQSLSNSSFNYDKYSVDCECDNHRSMTEINISENKELLDKINDNTAHIELKKQTVRSWIENSICKNNWANDIETDIYDSYCNDITKIVESIDLNITSSKTELDALPDTNTCIKYNLDSTNMSLIYSLTPPAAIEQEENDNDDTSWDLAERSSEWQSDSMQSDSCEALGDYIWIEPMTKDDSIKLQCPQDGTISSVSSYDLEQLESERHSANGSDILELPSCTISELKDIDGEVFHNGINESANEIIADLNTSDETLLYDALQVVQHIIAEIIESVYILSYLDSSIYDLSVIKEIVRRLIDSYHYEYSLTELADRACMTNVTTNDNDDNICRIKSFLGNLSSDFHYTNQIKIQEKEDQGYSAVIEFCTVAKKLPVVTVNDKTLELNFRILKVSRNEYTERFPDIQKIFCDIDDSIDNDNKQIFIESDEIFDKVEDKDTPIAKSDIEVLFDRYPYDQEEEEIMQKKCRLTPISEEPVMEGETPCETIDSVTSVLENHNNESLHNSEIDFVNAVEENTVNSTMAPVSLDGTYTISEISDNDETNDFQERCDIWDLSIDCMSYSYDTKEFIRLEKALADGS
jgi:hypothetical protein